MRLFVTGASSFVGAHFCRLAVARGHEVLGCWRSTPLRLAGVRPVQGDVTRLPRPEADVVVHLAAKVMAADAGAQNRALLDAVLGWRLPVAYASSTVVHWPRESAYRASRREDEARLAASGLPWLVVRPCAPYGPRLRDHVPRHTESFHRLVGLVRRAPVLPLPGGGDVGRQPVHVDDFNGAILALLERGAFGQAFDAGGPGPLTMRTVCATLARRMGRQLVILPVPTAAAALAARVLPGFQPELIRDFATDDLVDPRPLAAATGLTPRSFDEGAADLWPG